MRLLWPSTVSCFMDMPPIWLTLPRYWDFTKDYKHPSASPIFSTDPEIGFGTHGTIVRNEIGLGGYQVDNGAFANLTVSITRDINYSY